MLVVTLLAIAATASGVDAKMAFTLRRTRSAAASCISSGLKLVKRDREVFALHITRFGQTPSERGKQMRDPPRG
jgi:hypothetical protein